jgi:hypothetical protein
MVVIFIGATVPGPAWTTPAVLAIAVLTGAAAGAVLGAGLGWTARALTGAGLSGQLMLSVLNSQLHRTLPRGLVGLSVRGVRSGVWHRFPVIAVPNAAGDVVVAVGRADRKRWWRNLRGTGPHPVWLCRDGAWQPARAVLLMPGAPGYPAAVIAYTKRAGSRTASPPAAGTPLVRVTPDRATSRDDGMEPTRRRGASVQGITG